VFQLFCVTFLCFVPVNRELISIELEQILMGISYIFLNIPRTFYNNLG